MDFVVTSNGIRSNNITLQNKILQQNGKHNIDRQGSLIQNWKRNVWIATKNWKICHTRETWSTTRQTF